MSQRALNDGSQTDAALRTIDVRAGYGSIEILHGISLAVGTGEIVAIVGPNGAGKSTLLKVMSATLAPSAGSVELLNRPLAEYDRRELARTLAIVAQENSVAFQFTVLEVVLMGRAPHLGPWRFETSRDLEIARGALGHFDLISLAAHPIHELSGGERKRVFLARAMAQEPRVALLDEPTAFLDMKHVTEIFTRFRELCSNRGLAVVATLHDLNAAAMYADRVLLMKNGSSVAVGPPDEVLTVEALRDVYETDVYIGRNPVNGAITVLPASRV